MGGVVSSADDNDELVDNLVSAGYVKTPEVEKALRCVDRGHYYLDGVRNNAYRDLAWKHGFLHLSAPCIYAEVLECLELRPGLSFLNIGSGTGYLSTIAGFLLGTYGHNFGIELNREAVDYANNKLKSFMKQAMSLDFTSKFCYPKFVVGNCLQLDIANYMQSFDRVYCGAAVPPEHLDFVRNLAKIGGIIVLPLEDQLVQIKRLDVNSWDQTRVLPVSFATMVVPSRDLLFRGPTISLPPREPLSLLEICRAKTREALQMRLIEENHFNLRSLVSNYRRNHRGFSDGSADYGTDGSSDENADGRPSSYSVPSGNNRGTFSTSSGNNGAYSASSHNDGDGYSASSGNNWGGVDNGSVGSGRSVGTQSRGSGRLNPLRRALPYYRRLLVPLFNPSVEQGIVEAEGDRARDAAGAVRAGRGDENRRYMPVPNVRWATFFGGEPFYNFFGETELENGPSTSSQQRMNRQQHRQETAASVPTDGPSSQPEPEPQSNPQPSRKPPLKYRLKSTNSQTIRLETNQSETSQLESSQSEASQPETADQSETSDNVDHYEKLSVIVAANLRTESEMSVGTDEACTASESSVITDPNLLDGRRSVPSGPPSLDSDFVDSDEEDIVVDPVIIDPSTGEPEITKSGLKSASINDRVSNAFKKPKANSDIVGPFVDTVSFFGATVGPDDRKTVHQDPPARSIVEIRPLRSDEVDECYIPGMSITINVADPEPCGTGGTTSGSDSSAPKRTRIDSDPTNNESGVGPSRCKRSANWDDRSGEDESAEAEQEQERGRDDCIVTAPDPEGRQRVANEENEEGNVSRTRSYNSFESALDISVETLPLSGDNGHEVADSDEEREYEHAEEYEQQQRQRERMRAEREQNAESVRQISALVRAKVYELPLPESLKQFLNFNRTF